MWVDTVLELFVIITATVGLHGGGYYNYPHTECDAV